ncbi:MAG: sulfatase-like hydrolase/transferase [Polyangiaceae bacterium]|nr:sulfatase-like hydrolase/transferase [Polyangiaceae bacterium]
MSTSGSSSGPAPPGAPWVSVAADVVGGIAAAWLLAALEIAVVGLEIAPCLASSEEGSIALAALAPILIAGAGSLGAAGGLLVALARRAERHRPSAAFAAVWVGAAAAAVAWGVGSGRHLAAPGAREGFSLGVGALVGGGFAAGARRLGRELRERPERVAIAAAIAVGLVQLANRFVLVRLYPAFHQGLAASACVGAAFVAPAFVAPAFVAPANLGSRLRAWAGAAALAMAIAAALIPRSARGLAGFDNVRFLLLDAAPLGGEAVRLAAAIAPPPPLEPAQCDPGSACAPIEGRPRTLDWSERDLLVVTIDALRADHLGAYGDARGLTPALDDLARTGVRFERAYAATPHTSYSVVSLMTGKYMRPLLLQGAGEDSDTWAGLLRAYGRRTAAFYPPAVFFIDAERFEPFQRRQLDFEYAKVEFAEGAQRVQQVQAYLEAQPREQRLFVWVHLFAPHEPYVRHERFDHGEDDRGRYASEVAFADETTGALVRAMRAVRPEAVVLVTADHGEELGDHGGRYHGTTVYEEQVRVPLLVSAPGALAPRVLRAPVQTIDLLPTVLAAVGVPRPPRIRGRDLGGLLTGADADDPAGGFAFAETDEQTMLAEGPWRLVCARRLGACRLFDLAADAAQTRDLAAAEPMRLETLRRRSRELGASHGRYESTGLRAEGKGWPAPILRGLSGDGDAAEEIAPLLDDADREIRRKAAELGFRLRRAELAPALRLALVRDEDATVRGWAALALTRLGEGAPLVVELLASEDIAWRRLAALALAEAGDPRGEETLLAWWRDTAARDFDRSRELIAAFGRIRSRAAVGELLDALGDLRLRPHLAAALAAIDEPVARPALVRALATERYHGTRRALAEAVVALGGGPELAGPLAYFLGVPDPLPGGLELAERARIVDRIGGPDTATLARLARSTGEPQSARVIVPKGSQARPGVWLWIRGRNARAEPSAVRIGVGEPLPGEAGRWSRSRVHEVPVPPGAFELRAAVPPDLGVRSGRPATLRVATGQGVTLTSLAVLPEEPELPPPPPSPWRPGDAAPAASAAPPPGRAGAGE